MPSQIQTSSPSQQSRSRQQRGNRRNRRRQSDERSSWRRFLTVRNVIVFEAALLLIITVAALLRGTLNQPGADGQTGGSRSVVVAGTPVATAESAATDGRADTAGPCKGAGVYLASSSGGSNTGSSANVVLCSARPQLYTYTDTLLGLMAPAMDQRDDLWVGAMATNRLLRLNPMTGHTEGWLVPDGRHMVMETAIDQQGIVWFTEQLAGYIGRFDPSSGKFTQYMLDPIEGGNNAQGGNGGSGERPGAQALQIAADGQVWFTVPKQGWIGRLDPKTGAIHAYSVPSRTPDASAYPYDLTTTPDGHLWFGSLWYSGGGGAVGELDPKTGVIKLYPLRDPNGKVYALASDTRGRVWFTEFDAPRLGMVDPTSGKVHEFEVPTALGDPAFLYGVAVARSGDVWFGSSGTSSLVRYTPATQQFAFFRLNIGQNAPYELAFDQDGRVWFTSQGDTPSYIGMLATGSV